MLHSGLGTSIKTWNLEYNNEIGKYTKRNDKTNKMSKRLQ